MPALSEFLLMYGPLWADRFDREHAGPFNDQTRGVCALYERLLGRYRNDPCHKMIVCCVDQITDERRTTIMGICHVEAVVALSSFFDLTDREKQRFALEALMQGIRRVVALQGWGPEPFQRAYDQALALDYVNRYMWRRPAASPDRRYTAELWLDHGVHSCDFTVILNERRGRHEVLRQLVTQQPPDELIFANHLGRLEWLSPSAVALFDKDGAAGWTVGVPPDLREETT